MKIGRCVIKYNLYSNETTSMLPSLSKPKVSIFYNFPIFCRPVINEVFNRFLPSTVSRALDCWSGGHEFKPPWGQFLTKFILCCVTSDLSDNLTEMRQISLSWKTRIAVASVTTSTSEFSRNTQSCQCWHFCIA